MEAIQIEILNPKAFQLIKGLQDLNLIRINEEPATALKKYLKKMRSKSAYTPSDEEIADIVNEVRAERYGKK